MAPLVGPPLASETVPMHRPRCAMTCFTLFSHCSTRLEPSDTLMAKKAIFGPCGPFWESYGTPRRPSLTRETVPMHHSRCAMTCSALVSFWATRMEPTDTLTAQKGHFWPFWTLLGVLWHTQMATSDPHNCSNASPSMCPDLFHPCSTPFHQREPPEPLMAQKGLVLALCTLFGAMLGEKPPNTQKL